MSIILVIDDEKSIRNTLKDVLEYKKHEVDLAEDGAAGINLYSSGSYDVVLCDIKMQKMDGIEVLGKLMEISSTTPVVMISGHGNIDTAVEAIKKGAFDFLEKPLDLNRLLITIRNAMDKSKLITQTQVLKNKVSKMYDIVGESEAIKMVRDMIDRVAPTEARVLITGSNGTGKELVAHQIHEKSSRSKGRSKAWHTPCSQIVPASHSSSREQAFPLLEVVVVDVVVVVAVAVFVALALADSPFPASLPSGAASACAVRNGISAFVP